VVGLGTGSLACHKRGKEEWIFFEIDPDVVEIARDPRFFSFISACAPHLPVVLGDARLTLAASPERYDLIVLDAFSSDAIPVHLLTREALAGYLARLTPGGALVMHISNRHMELGSVVAAVAAAEGLVAYLKEDHRPDVVPTDFKMNALVAALARKSADLGDLPSRPGWQTVEPDPGVAAWTDDYSNIFGAILRKKLGQ
jgi:spermidine synthase